MSPTSPTPSISASVHEVELGSVLGGSDGSRSHNSGLSSSQPSTSTGVSRLSARQDQSDDDDQSLATKDTRHLTKLRFFLITILFWSTVGVGLAVWTYFTEDIQEGFVAQYIEEAIRVVTVEQTNFLLAVGSIDNFVLSLCMWPSVTPSQYAIQADRLRKFSTSVAVTSYFYADGEMVQEWDQLSSLNAPWVGGSTFQKGEDTLETNVLQGREINKGNESFLALSQQSPVVDGSSFARNGFQNQALADAWDIFHREKGVVMSYVNNVPTSENPDMNIEENNEMIDPFVGNETNHKEPFGDIFYPIMTNCSEEGTLNSWSNSSSNDIIGVIAVTFYWRDMLTALLFDAVDGMHIVIENTCNQTVTYTWSQREPTYLGAGDLHEPAFDVYEVAFLLSDIEKNEKYTGLPMSSEGCQYVLRIYPSEEMLINFQKTQLSPSAITGIAVVIFIFTSMVFIFYDCLVERRQRKVYSSALRNNAIVSSLFPKNVRDRLYKENDPNPKKSQPARSRLKTFMHEENDAADKQKNEPDAPIADLFSNCTVLFADISGFTSWASERSPSQVFILLETIYGAFDKIADRRGVFKVETIGDCYMAVTGLPTPKRDHAVNMVRFARDCRIQMNVLTTSLEISLGPETSELSMRFGLHSGPVTAGVLRGQKSRFQLFGDTVNTAARLESTGSSNRIHVSEETARLLKEAGKARWLTPREDAVQAKGKGELKTYWVFERSGSKKDSGMSVTTYSDSSVGSFGSASLDPDLGIGPNAVVCDKRKRLIDWNVDLFAGLIRKIVARRNTYKKIKGSKRDSKLRGSANGTKKIKGGMALDEVVEIIELPAFNPKTINVYEDPYSIQLDEEVMEQLKHYIFMISSKYNANPFHSFEHASHVTMSVAKLLSRIVAPDLEVNVNDAHSTLHDHTYGITSDPLTHFACILSALIHDVDHQGVPNSTLVEEDGDLAKQYNGRSVAEQNSVDIAWGLLLEPQFSILRDTICATDTELVRLRQLVVNSVLATDIMDKDLKQLRNERWEKAFSSDSKDNTEDEQNRINRKATIVLEHLIQASDVCHTMQHWHVYRKWNERLFEEMYLAYKVGRAKVDPATFWYNGELGFFDHYIIPLTKKLSECGVFGVSSDEYLNYALRNRKEWEQRGEAIVAEALERVQRKLEAQAEDEEV